ncbi:MAG TPA: ATP-binding protein [Longimicrobiales bacterium]|nr:ATP-binding protein [Longimicrobiales bacterium]
MSRIPTDNPLTDDAARELAGVQRLLASFSDVAQLFDRQWRWLFMNEAAREWVRDRGRDPDSLLGECLWDIFPNSGARGPSERAVRENRELSFELSVPALDAIYETRIVPVPQGVLTLSRDVTARRGREEDLLRQNAELDLERRRLRAVLEILPAGVWIADGNGRIIESNPAAAELWAGAAPHSRDPSEYHHDYRGRWAETGDQIGPGEWGLARAVRRGETSRAEEIEIDCADGSTRTILNYAVPIRDAIGRTAGAIALSVDISEQKRAQRAQQLLAELLGMLATATDVRGALTMLTRYCAGRIADYAVTFLVENEERAQRISCAHADPAKEPICDAIMALDAGEQTRAQGRFATEMLAAGRTLLLRDLTPDDVAAIAPDPQVRRLVQQLEPTSFLVVPLRVRQRTLAVLALASVRGGRPRFTTDDQPLAEQIALRAALAVDNARLLQEAQAASQAKSQFLATMSHELRTPLTAIIGYDELLLNELWGPLTDRQRQQLDRIRVSAWHLVTIIDQILTFSRAEAGREQAQREPTELTQLVRETVAMLEPQALAKELRLELRLPDQPVWAQTDAGKLRQILLNLAGNAVKFTDRGSVGIALLPGDIVEIRIRDTGTGVAPVDLERIFEPFTQVDQSNTRAQGGTGLGLTVSRRLARLLGGDIRLESQLGVGSTFTLTLPR